VLHTFLTHLIHLWFTPTGYERWVKKVDSVYKLGQQDRWRAGKQSKGKKCRTHFVQLSSEAGLAGTPLQQSWISWDKDKDKGGTKTGTG
jgi:hypothetical protein